MLSQKVGGLMNRFWSRVGYYGLAFLATSLAITLRWAMIPLLGLNTLYLFLFPVIMIICFRLGFWPSLWASAWGIVITEAWLDSPHGHFNLTVSALGRGAMVFALAWFLTTYLSRKIQQSKDLSLRQKQELLVSQSLLREVMEGTPDPIFVKDRDSRLLLANPAALAVVGKSPDVMGKDDSAFINDPELARITMGNDRRVMTSGRTGVYEERIPGPEGIRIFLTTKTPHRDAAGHITGIIGVAHDITERKRVEQDLKEQGEILRLYVKHAPGAIAMFDRQMNYLAYSDRWLANYGLGQQDLIGRSHYEVFPEITETWKTIHQRCLQGASEQREEDPFVRGDGRIQWLRWEIHPWRTGEGQVGGIVMFTEDITQRKQAEEALRQSEDRYRGLVEQSPNGIFINRNNRVAFVNPAGLRLFGASDAGQIVGKSPFELFPPDYHPLLQMRMRQLHSGQAVPLIESTIVCLDGGLRAVEVIASRFVDQEGPADQVILRDITERKKARAIMTRYQLISKYARDPLLLVSRDGKIAEVNQAAESFYGYTRAELLHLRIQDLRTGEDEELIRRQTEQARTQGILFEAMHVRKDGTRVPVEVSAQSVMVDGQEMMLSVIRDITKRKNVEAALQEADHRKDEFLAMLAHELRNPLAPIRNAVHILRLRGTGDPALQRQQDMIDRQVTHMAHLLDDLMDVSRITRGKITLHKQRVALAEIFAQAVEAVSPMIASRQHNLEISPVPAGLFVEGDPDRLVQIVGNLLTNAAKYTEEGGRIGLEAGREGQEAVIRVRDTGIGLAPDMLEKIFDLFAQVKRDLDRSQGGLGIGLTIVRNLVRMHGGTVAATSQGLGKGSEFVVRLPVSTTAGVKPCAECAILKGEHASRRILVVDDVSDTVQSLSEILGFWGHDVRMAQDGASALETAKAFKPDIILLDIGLPGLDGYAVARKIRADAGNTVAIISMSGYGQESDRQNARAAGIDQHLVKPVDLDYLKKMLEEKPGSPQP
jgi:PAS domain S-box-containing protein